MKKQGVRTPDGKYIVVVGKAGPRLWRATNPALTDDLRVQYIKQLMDARRTVRDAKDETSLARARAAVDKAKRLLGERGQPWWNDGTPDLNRTLVKNSPYLQWWTSMAD